LKIIWDEHCIVEEITKSSFVPFFWQKFSEINVFTKEIASKRVNFTKYFITLEFVFFSLSLSLLFHRNVWFRFHEKNGCFLFSQKIFKIFYNCIDRFLFSDDIFNHLCLLYGFHLAKIIEIHISLFSYSRNISIGRSL